MATDNSVESLFNTLETRRSLLFSCTSLYQTLTSHFHSLHLSISSKSQTLDTLLQTLDSDFQSSLTSLTLRQQSLPLRLSSLTSQIQTLTNLALSHTRNPVPDNPYSIADELKSLCVQMDAHELLKFVMSKRKESADLKKSIGGALGECVDSPRLVLDSVREFMDLKANVKSGQLDRRWACGIVVVGMFPFDELKKREEDSSVLFSRAVFERAEGIAKEWKEKALERAASGVATVSGEGSFGMGPCEASMFLHFVAGFGLKNKFEYEFLKSLVLEFPSRKDIAKLAGPLFGNKLVEGIIKELLQIEKDVDAVYFAIEAGLTEKFNPVSLLKSFLLRAEKNADDTLRKGDNSSEAADEASIIERTALRHIMRSVEGNKLEDDFPLTSVKERLGNLEKIMNEKKAALDDGGSKSSSHKRGRRSSGPPLPHPPKVPRFSGSHRPPYRQRNLVSPVHQNSVSRYPAPYGYPSQTTYGGPHLPSLAQAAPQPQPYAVQYGVIVGGTVPQVGGSYGGGQLSYVPLNTYPPLIHNEFRH